VLPWVAARLCRGDELPVQRVTFTFNTPMSRVSVETSFSVTPAAPGAFRWQDDNTAFTYLPAKPLDRDTAYIFEINSGARSRLGKGLRDIFSLKLHTTGYLAVTQFLPEEDAGIQLQPTITIVFNRPVVPLGTAEQMQKLPAPFSSSPTMTGSGQWLTTSIYSYKPTTPLQSGTEYKITLPRDLTDVSGSSLKEDVSFHFKTLSINPPKPKTFSIHYLTPVEGATGIFRSPIIRVGFDSPADIPSAQAGFSLLGPDGQVLPGKFEWKAENNELRFRPDALLDYSTRYSVKIDRTNIRSKDGLPLTTNAVASFTTLGLPEIVSTSPADGSLVDPSAIVSIRFSAPMRLDDLISRVEVSPKIPSVALDSNIGPDSMSARVQFATLPSTVYTITLNTKGLVDTWGTQVRVDPKVNVYKIVGQDKIQFRYVTGALGPAVSLETAGLPMGLYNAYHQTRVFVTHRNIGTVGMMLYSISLPLFLNQSNNGARRPDEKESLVRRWVVPVYNPQNVMRYDLLSITTDGASIGQEGNVVCVEAAPSVLAVGQKVRVVRREIPKDENATPSVPASINVRNQPGTQNTAVIGEAPNGTEFNVLDGPVCADRYVWWKVQSEDGKRDGWIAEGDLKQPYVVPLTEAGALATSPATLQASATPPATVPVTLSPTATQMAATAAATPAATDQPTVMAGKLAPGIYRLEMEAPEITNNNHHVIHVMLVATDNITLKVAGSEALAWVTDLKSGQPAGGVPVQFYRLMQIGNQQKVLPYGKAIVTDRDGLARLDAAGGQLRPEAEVIYAAVASAGHFGLAASTWVQGIDAGDFQQPTMFQSRDIALYLYTDRRLYRPGDTVYFRGTIRNRDDAVYSLSEKKLIPVDIIDPFDQVIYSKKLPVNEYGSFSDSFTLDSGGQLGEYQIVARPNKPEPRPTGTPTPAQRTPIVNLLTPTPTQPPIPVMEARAKEQPDDPQFITQITVAHYTPPEFRVSVKPQAAHVAPGDSVLVGVEASYYFGGPVSNATVQWEVRIDPYYFYYTGSGYYSFEDYNQDQIVQDYEDDRPQMTASGTGRTDAQGRYTIELPATLGKSRRSVIYTVEAVVWDQSNQMVAQRGQVAVDRGLFQVGVGVDNYVGAVNDKQSVRVIAVNNNSEPLPNTFIDVQVVRRVWASVQTIEPGTGRTIWENAVVEEEVARARPLTDSAGKGRFNSRRVRVAPTRFTPAPGTPETT
jgi:hypothetical protein